MSESVVGAIFVCFAAYLGVYVLVKLLNKTWWTPRRVEKMMSEQGIRGPPYRILHGNTKEMGVMKRDVTSRPLGFSDNIVPRVAPHVHTWSKLYGNWKKFLGDGLVTSRGEKWHKMRKLTNHAFKAESLKGMTPAMVSSVEMMVERWRKQEVNEIDACQEFKVLTSEIISRTAFGSSYLEGERIFGMLMKLGKIVSETTNQVRLPGIGKLYKTSSDIESDKLEQGIREGIIKLIRSREEMVKSGKEKSYGVDFLGQLLEAHHSDDPAKKITIDDMIDECKTFYIGGNETTTNALCWAFLLLAIHEDWQEKVRNEVFEFFGKDNPDHHGISRLTIMGTIVNESLRMYSPSIGIPRKTTRKVKLGNWILPANTEVFAAITMLHYNPMIWGEDAHVFNPDRFAHGVAKATKNNPAAFVPFGMGPRICVGLNFAMIEMKVALAMILQRYRFAVAPSYAHAPIHLLTVSPQYGMQIVLHPL